MEPSRSPGEPPISDEQARVAPPSAPPVAAAAPAGGWAVAAGRGTAWWRDGWRLFTAAPWAWIGATLVFVILLFVVALIPVLGQILSTLLYPVLGAGLLVGARAQERGERFRLSHLFACFDHRLGPLMLAGVLYIAGWFVIWLIAMALCVAIFGFSSLAALFGTDLTQAGLETLATFGMVMVVALLIVLTLGTPLMMAYWFAPALVAFRGDTPVAAMKASFTASLRNVPPLLVYSVLGLLLGIAATLMLGLGWIVLAPVFVASVYASYRDIFGTPA